MVSPLKPEHAEDASRLFGEYLKREGLLAVITEQECKALAGAFLHGFACGVGTGAADAALAGLPEPGVFQHTGMSVCNKGWRHLGRCDFGNGI